MNDLIRTRDLLLATLAAQQDQRSRYDGDCWIAAERQVMLDATNQERHARRLPPVSMAEIERVERWAVGHCDYSSKFALYCAEIALGRPGMAP